MDALHSGVGWGQLTTGVGGPHPCRCKSGGGALGPSPDGLIKAHRTAAVNPVSSIPPSPCHLCRWGPGWHARTWARGGKGRTERREDPELPKAWPPRRTLRVLPAKGGSDIIGPASFRKDTRNRCERARDTGRLVSRPEHEAAMGYGGGNGREGHGPPCALGQGGRRRERRP